jgi:RimJ/RimL family protein N-acetyltransferase
MKEPRAKKNRANGTFSLFLSKGKMLFLNSLVYLKKEGLLSFLRLTLWRLGFQCFDRSLIFFVRDLDQLADIHDQPYTFSILTLKDIEDAPNYDDGFYSKRRALYRLQKGYRLFVLREGHELAFFTWIETGVARIPWFNHLPLNLPKNIAYMAAVYTAPQFRNRGIATRTKKEIFRYLKEDGYTYIIEVIHPNNSVALKVDKSLGFREYQTIRYRRYWYLKIYNIKKVSSSESKTVISFFRSPKHIWETFL